VGTPKAHYSASIDRVNAKNPARGENHLKTGSNNESRGQHLRPSAAEAARILWPVSARLEAVPYPKAIMK
jgi:hypothetical protein